MKVDDERLARILDALREKGGRLTPARRAIVTALVDAKAHVTADELAATVQGQLPDVHLSTIYRTLERLEELGFIEHVHLGHGRAIYQLADDRHHHLVCDRCGWVTGVPADLLDEVAANVKKRYDFVLDPSHFSLGGFCRECAASEG
jgi:Fur family ferric uptake transcriptional regulator